jgi:hypothetical protein
MKKKVLIITKSSDKTADHVISKMHERQVFDIRLNTDKFPEECNIGLKFYGNDYFGIKIRGEKLELKEINKVWLRRLLKPEVPEIQNLEARNFAEQEYDFCLRWFLNILPCNFFDKEDNLIRARNKFSQLFLAQKLGLKIPETLITNNCSDAKNFLTNFKDVIVKTIAGYGVKKDGGFESIYTNKMTIEKERFLNSLPLSPVCFQRDIEKKFELRITIVYPQIFTCRIDSQNTERTMVDWRRYDIKNTPHLIYDLPQDFGNKLLKMMEYYNIHFASFDVVVTPKNDMVFLEMNPNSQWVWIELLTGLPITDTLIDRLIE